MKTNILFCKIWNMPFIAWMICFGVVDSSFAKSADTFEDVFIRGNEKIEIKITQKKFDPKNHRISERNWKIDGSTPFGVDGYAVNPLMEIGQFSITWNGNNIPMPDEMYKDCFSPCLNKANPKNYIGDNRKRGEAIADEGITLRWDAEHRMLQIIMVSMEWAAAPYFVIWYITPYGIHSRKCIVLGS